MRRKTKAPIDDRPVPWEERPISRERWERHRDWMMAAAGPGQRPQEWWRYEKGCRQPAKQTQALYTMGELRADELARLMTWWRDAYEEANEVITVGSYGPSRKTPEERQKYLDDHSVPRELVQQWDAEGVKGAA